MKTTPNQATIDTVDSIQETSNKLREMKRPQKYFLFPLFRDLPHEEWIFSFPPAEHDTHGYRMNSDGTAGTYMQLYKVYIDTRYKARLRLFYYLHPERKPTGKSIYAGTEIGESLPILNF